MQATIQRARGGWLQLLREALAGTEQDFTEGSLSRAIALLAVPTVLEMFMESTFAIVDAFWVARLGADALATVGLTESLLVLIFSVALGLSMAATATVARRIGEKDPEGASIAAVQAIGIGIGSALAIGAGGAWFAPQLLGLMHATPEIVRTGSHYAAIVLGGNICVMMLFLINGVFRGAGDAAQAMRTLWLANLINLVLDPLFIYGLAGFPKLGVTGAAVATTTGRSIGVLYQFWVLFSGRGRIVVARRHLRLDWPVLRRLLGVARTAMFQYFISTASWMSLARINAQFGSAAIAGYALAIRIIMFAHPALLGDLQRRRDAGGAEPGGEKAGALRARGVAGRRLQHGVPDGGRPDFLFGGAGAGRCIHGRSGGGARSPSPACKYVSLGYPFYAWGMVMEQAFNGAGDTVTPTWINLGCYWMLQIPLAWGLADAAGLGPRGVYLAICIAESVLALVSVVLFRRGRWKQVRI